MGKFLEKMWINTMICGASLISCSGLFALHQDLSEGVVERYEEKIRSIRGMKAPGRQIKIHDLVDIVGEEKVKMSGFGVVTGLQGSGDSGAAAIKMLLTVAEKQGIRIDQNDVKNKNIALVSISAEVHPYQKNFDIAVKSVGDAKSLQNGFLEASSLHPIGNSEVYAIGSGTIALGSRYYEAQGGGANGGAASVTIGHPTAGFVIQGGQLVKALPTERESDSHLKLFIKHPNNRTASNIASAINHWMHSIDVHAEPTNASLVTIALKNSVYKKQGTLTRLIADIGDLPVDVVRDAVITIDQGSGVIAMTEGVKMEPGSIAVAGLTVTVSSDITPVSRQGLTDGELAFIDIPELQISEDQANFLSVPAGTDLRKVQETLNALKLKPTSIISVFNAMHKAGMIHADIVVLPK